MVRQAHRKGSADLVATVAAPGDSVKDDATALILCMGRKVLPFTQAQVKAERQGRHGNMFSAGYWTRLEGEVQASIRRGLL